MNFLLLFNRNNKIILMNDKSRNKYVITITIIIIRHVINLLLLLLLLFFLLSSNCINRNTPTRDFDKFVNVQHVNFCPCSFLSEKLHITHGCSKFFTHSHVFSGNHCTILFRIIDRRSNTILRGERK